MEDTKKATYNYLDKYLIEIRAEGRYSFTTEELKNQFSLSPNALNQILYRYINPIMWDCYPQRHCTAPLTNNRQDIR